MAEKKKWPTVSKHHYFMYATLLGKYGLSRMGVFVANTQMLVEFDLDDTRTNRKWIMNKFRSANPQSRYFKEDYRPPYEAGVKIADIDEIRSEQAQRADAKLQILDNLTALLNLETASENFLDDVSNTDILKFVIQIATDVKVDEYKSKLFGLLTERSKVEISSSGEADVDTGDISDLPGLSEVGEEDGSTESD